MRPAFDQESYDVAGKPAEERFHEYLHKRGMDHVWLNEEGESKKRGDFIAGRRRIEVEHKDIDKYRAQIEAEGIDVLADKVEKHSPQTLYVIEHGSGFYSMSMANIKAKGKLIKKITRRGIIEKFYRIPLASWAHVTYI